MRIDIMTLFPESLGDVLSESILGRAQERGFIHIDTHQIRDYTANKQCQVDDYPYGGGWGCVMMAQPLKSCLDDIMAKAGERKSRVIYMSPQGKPYTQETAKRLKRDYDHLVLVCGHYEGIDERFIEECVDEEISLGDFVLTGGEIAAMAVADSVCRMVPGVLSDEQCYTGESHWDGLLEYPQYTRPECWEGRKVPEILLNGDHGKVERWRRKQQLRRTMEKRPDMFEKLELNDKEDKILLQELKREAKCVKLTQPLSYRRAVASDFPDMLEMTEYARKSLKRLGADQWQGDYPNESDFAKDVERGESYIILHGEEKAAFFVLSERPDECYEHITDGKWSADIPYCVAHRAAVAEKYRGSGISHYLMDCIEELTRLAGRKAVRIDTHRKNKPMKALLKDHGYRYRGNVEVVTSPGCDCARQAFEKILKKSGGEK